MRGDRLLGVLSQVVPQVPAVGDLDRGRGAVPGALGVGPGSVRQIASAPGCAFSHASKVAASRSGSRSVTSPVRMSTSTVPYTWPLASAKSSTPSTSGAAVTSGSGAAATSRSTVEGCTAMPRVPASRAAARRPAPAEPASMPAAGRCAAGTARSPAACSANVTAGHPGSGSGTGAPVRRSASGHPPRRPPPPANTRHAPAPTPGRTAGSTPPAGTTPRSPPHARCLPRDARADPPGAGTTWSAGFRLLRNVPGNARGAGRRRRHDRLRRQRGSRVRGSWQTRVAPEHRRLITQARRSYPRSSHSPAPAASGTALPGISLSVTRHRIRGRAHFHGGSGFRGGSGQPRLPGSSVTAGSSAVTGAGAPPGVTRVKLRECCGVRGYARGRGRRPARSRRRLRPSR